MNFLMVLLILTINVIFVNSSRILAIVPTPSYSHQISFSPIWKSLLSRGHEITLLTTNPLKDPVLTNLTEIDLSSAYYIWNIKHNASLVIESAQKNIFLASYNFRLLNNDILEEELSNSEVEKLISTPKNYNFDLVITEIVYPPMYAFAELYNCPLVGISSMDTLTTIYNAMGNFIHPIVHPDLLLPFVPPLNLYERLFSTLYITYGKFYVKTIIVPENTAIVRKHFGPHFPDVGKLFFKMSLILINVNPILSDIKPLLPNIVPIGDGNHISGTKKLPQYLKDVLDSNPRGIVYFSLGTNVKKENLSPKTTQIILKAFSELPYTFLWKYDGDDLKNVRNNVIISKWLPQQDILKHRNVKLFITQGGWQSIEESILSHTPMIGLPFFGDQPGNIKRMVQKGVALCFWHKSLVEEDFKKGIVEVVENPKYLKKVKELAILAKDQPMTGVERAVWWIEYVLRHNGTHFENAAVQMPLYQFLLIDVISFYLILVLVLVLILIWVLKFLKYLLRALKKMCHA